jgi:hypothetical protein
MSRDGSGDELTPAQRARQRAESAGARAAELAARARAVVDNQIDHQTGSTTEQTLLAAQKLDTARAYAAIAAVRAASARQSSADAHDRAATVHEWLASGGHGDVGEHRRRAAGHRASAVPSVTPTQVLRVTSLPTLCSNGVATNTAFGRRRSP